jgi:transposase
VVLINSSSGRKINRGVVKQLASSYQVSIDVIYRIWRQLNQTGAVDHKKTNCGRKRKNINIEKIRDIPLHKRESIRSISNELETNTRQIHQC